MTISLEFPPHAWNIIYKHVFPQFFFHGKTANLALRKAKIPKIQFDWQLNCRTVVLLPQSLKSLEMESEGDLRPQRCVVIQNGAQPTMTVPMNPELKAREKARIEKLFPKKMRWILSLIQLYFGGTAGLLQIFLVGMASSQELKSNLGAGVWCGLVIGITGGIGLIATNKPSRRIVKALLIMSIFATIFAMILIIIAWYSILESRPRSNFKVSSGSIKMTILLISTLFEIFIFCPKIQL